MMTAVSKYLFSMSRKVLSRSMAQPCQNGDSSLPFRMGIFSYQWSGKQASGYCGSSSPSARGGILITTFSPSPSSSSPSPTFSGRAAASPSSSSSSPSPPFKLSTSSNDVGGEKINNPTAHSIPSERVNPDSLSERKRINKSMGREGRITLKAVQIFFAGVALLVVIVDS